MTPDALLIGLLAAMALGTLSWIAYTTHRTAVSVAEIGAELKAGHEKFANHERELIELRAKVALVEIGLAQLKR